MRKKTLCLLVVISFIASLLGIAVPAQPAAASVPGDMQWVRQDLPPNTTRLSTGPIVLLDGTVLLATVDSVTGPTLWKGSTSGAPWQAIFMFSLLPGSVGPFLTISGGQAIYIFDRAVGGSTYRSLDLGLTWAILSRLTTSALTSATFQSPSTGYMSDSSGNIYKTTDSAQSWTLLSPGPGVGNITQLVAQSIAGASWLLVGGNGAIAYSSNGAPPFTIISGTPGENYRVTFDGSFATNNTIYLGDASGSTGKTYRFKIGVDAAPVDTLAPSAGAGSPVIFLTFRSGVLYSFYASLVDRTTNPLGIPGSSLFWRTMDVVATPPLSGMVGGTVGTVGETTNIAYMRNGGYTGPGFTPQLWAYSDYLAIARPELTSPASGFVFDPAQQVTLAWEGMGSGTGQVIAYQVQITDKAPDWSGALSSPTIAVADPAAPSITIGPGGQFAPPLVAGKTYQWRVRARNEASFDGIDSKWSDPRTLIAKATAGVTLGNLNQTYDGTSKPATVTTNPPGLPVVVTYDGSATAPTNAGSYAVVATVNSPIYQGSAAGTLVIAKADQTITFGALANKTYGDPPFTVSATASSNLPVSFSIASGSATISENTVTITGAGAVTVRASQAGNGNYNPAPNVDQSFTVNKADQTISFGALANKTYGDGDFSVSATAGSGLEVTFTASGACTISGTTVHITGLGSATITAHQGGDSNFNAAPDVSQSFTVGITYARLNELVDQWVTKQGIVNSLSAKLDAARDAEARGDFDAKAGMIGAFINEVEAQTSKSLSQENAALLIALANAL